LAVMASKRPNLPRDEGYDAIKRGGLLD
jgi:hypothetical protein